MVWEAYKKVRSNLGSAGVDQISMDEFEANRSKYLYRPNRNAHQALESLRKNCRETDWVVDLDIKGFFDNIDHNKLLLAIDKHVSEKWLHPKHQTMVADACAD